LLQNLAPASSRLPQDAQLGVPSAAPQALQKRPVAAAPQLGQ
jgi:hypothetical protein